MHDYELYSRAEKLLEKGWTTGGWETPDGAFCLTGAFGRIVWDAADNDRIKALQRRRGDSWAFPALTGAEYVPQRIWRELANEIHVSPDRHHLERWNDAPTLFKRRRVLRLVRKLRKRHERDWLRVQAEADATERARVDAELDQRLAFIGEKEGVAG